MFVVDIYEFDLYASVLATFLTPFLYAPIEAFLISKTQTTLGKYLLHLKYTKKFNFKQALTLSIRNVLFLKTNETLEKKAYSKRNHFIALFISALLTFSFNFPDTALNYTAKALPFQFLQELKVKRNGGGNCPDGWSKLKIEETSPFLMFFPDTPILEEISKPIAHSDFVINYKEYTFENYSLGHVDLPGSWTKWGSNLVFKGSLQQVLKKESGNIIEKKKTIFENYPALDYKIQRDNSLTNGRLILVDNTLYKLEVKCCLDTTQISKDSPEAFFNAFHLVNKESS
jgi:hypothetical protein